MESVSFHKIDLKNRLRDIGTVYHGDCLDVLQTLDDNSVDSIVTDPPYGLKFMKIKWDSTVPTVEVWKECLRVVKPGGYILAFGGARTYHRLATYIEDAGFEIRDMCLWLYGEGFPKSLNISKQIDKMAEAERDIVGKNKAFGDKKAYSLNTDINTPVHFMNYQTLGNITAPSTDQAKRWDGWGTNLKPAHEPIVMARKPLDEPTVAQNVIKYGTGGINIDESRIETKTKKWNEPRGGGKEASKDNKAVLEDNLKGRYPSDLIHDGSQAVESVFPYSESGGVKKGRSTTGKSFFIASQNFIVENRIDRSIGNASRYFYCTKASQKDRNENIESNHHPTVKPTALMQYLVKLVTQPNGIVLDPFMGSGSTGKACMKESFTFIGIEKEEDYFNIAKARIVNDRSNHELF